mgnify:CR=1 FL=1
MNPNRFNFYTSEKPTKQVEKMPTVTVLTKLKARCSEGWLALGNILLFIGGDDSVEIGLQSNTTQLFTHSTISLSSENNRGQSS